MMVVMMTMLVVVVIIVSIIIIVSSTIILTLFQLNSSSPFLKRNPPNPKPQTPNPKPKPSALSYPGFVEVRMVPARPGMAFVECVFARAPTTLHHLQSSPLSPHSRVPFVCFRYDDEMHAGAALQGLQVSRHFSFKNFANVAHMHLPAGVSHHRGNGAQNFVRKRACAANM